MNIKQCTTLFEWNTWRYNVIALSSVISYEFIPSKLTIFKYGFFLKHQRKRNTGLKFENYI